MSLIPITCEKENMASSGSLQIRTRCPTRNRMGVSTITYYRATPIMVVDAGSIFAYKLARNLNRNAHVVVEVVHRQNMAFMGDQDSDKGFSNYRMSPQFASGSLFTSSMLDTLICQQFYNPELTSIVAQLISGMDREKENLYWRKILGNTDEFICRVL